MPSEGSERPSFADSSGFPLNADVQQFISTRDAHTLHTYFAKFAARRVVSAISQMRYHAA
jgi:hypothetical protein